MGNTISGKTEKSILVAETRPKVPIPIENGEIRLKILQTSAVIISRLLRFNSNSYLSLEKLLLNTELCRRTIALTPSTLLMLADYRNKKEAEAVLLDKPLLDSDLLFGDFNDKPVLPDTVSHAWLKLVRKMGIRVIRLHDARHTHASIMLRQGIHPKIVQERLGHASIQITLDTYSHVSPGLQRAAANSFDAAFATGYNKPISSKLVANSSYGK